MGIEYKVEDKGKVYPLSEQASSVLDLLRYEIQRLGIQEICEAEVVKIKKTGRKTIMLLLCFKRWSDHNRRQGDFGDRRQVITKSWF